MQHRSPTTSHQNTTTPEASDPLSQLEMSSLSACEERINNRLTYRSPHFPEPVRYIDNPVFHQPEAWRTIVDVPANEVSRSPSGSSPSSGGELAALLRHPTLTPEKTTQLFLKMNFLKFRAVEELKSLGEAPPSSEQLNTITTLLQAAKEIKDLVVQSNTRFAVMATRGFVSGRSTRDDLLSIGLETLMTCTDGFDCSKGFRFSTYVGVALRGVYIRAAAVSNTRELASLTNEEFRLDPTDVRENPTLSGSNHTYLREELSAALAQLSPRDQVVLTHRILKEETLQAVGERIGMTKEGTRLAVLKALKNLRKVMQFDPRDDFL